MKVKQIVLTTFLVVFLIILNIMPVSAKSYSINSADFSAICGENGDVLITETWNVSFDGDYTRFYKDINENASSLENFNVEFYRFTINGIEVSETTDIENRPANHYSIQTTENGLKRIAWYIDTTQTSNFVK